MKTNLLMIGLTVCVVGSSLQSVCGKEPPTSEQQLLSGVEAALKAKDPAALAAFVNWQGVSAQMRSMHADGLAAMVKQEIKTVKLAPLPAGFKLEHELNGVRYRPNVTVVGMIEVQHAQPGNADHLPYGKKDNAFYLVGTIEEKFAAPAATKEKSLNIMVMGTSSPEPVVFEGTYVYLKGGKEITEEISGKGNRSKGFWGDHVKHCEVRKKSGAGWISLVISEDGKPVFESPQETAAKPIIYDAKF